MRMRNSRKEQISFSHSYSVWDFTTCFLSFDQYFMMILIWLAVLAFTIRVQTISHFNSRNIRPVWPWTQRQLGHFYFSQILIWWFKRSSTGYSVLVTWWNLSEKLDVYFNLLLDSGVESPVQLNFGDYFSSVPVSYRTMIHDPADDHTHDHATICDSL